MGFENKVHFLGHVENMDEFWQDKNYLLNTSIHEGHNVSILEAMARGVMPIVHNFRGAKELYPESFLYDAAFYAADLIVKHNKYYPKISHYLEDFGWTFDNQIKCVLEVLNV
jgi:glycosyltransferase involved in cell wall biosynthesis